MLVPGVPCLAAGMMSRVGDSVIMQPFNIMHEFDVGIHELPAGLDIMPGVSSGFGRAFETLPDTMLNRIG